ncbi:MAG: hypothetical protein ABL907_12340, partial [Hyphomicrobium sp.]
MTSTPFRKKIGTAAVNALPPDTTLWDTEIKGFCIRRQKSPTVSYLLKTRVGGKVRWFTIGRHGQPWTADAARKRALAILVDPSIAEKQLSPETPQTFAAVAEEFLANHGPKLKPNSLFDYQRYVRNYLNPAFGRLPIDALTRAHVSKAHSGWSKAPRAANSALTVLSKLMTWSED